MRTILLTGGTGFVGKQILSRLLLLNCRIRMVVRKPVNVPPQVDLVIVEDLFSLPEDQLNAICAGVDTIIHAAWYAVPGKYLTSDENLACLSGSLRLARASLNAGVRRFVGVGTCFEYDLSTGFLRTNSPIAPATLYGACKASAFLTLAKLAEREGQSFAWCRLFYLYGEGEDPRRLAPYIRSQLSQGLPAELTCGNQIRDYLDVNEAGKMIADVAISGVDGPLNICSGKPITVADLARRIADEYGRRDLLIFGARLDTPGDPPCVFGEPSTVAREHA